MLRQGFEAPSGFRIERLDSSRHDREAFCCGVESVDRYLKAQAAQSQSKNLASTHVLLPVVSIADDAKTAIAGFVTLVPITIPLLNAPPQCKKLTNRPELHAQLIAQMGVDGDQKGKGLGKFLVTYALVLCWEISKLSAVPLVIVDAENDGLISFYRKFGFESMPGSPRRLFLPIATVGKLLQTHA